MSPTSKMQLGDIVAQATVYTSHTTGPRGQRRRKIQHPKPGELDAPVLLATDDEGEEHLWKVRLYRKVREGDGLYMGRPLTHSLEVYLDGTQVSRSYGDGRITKDNREVLAPMATVNAARTKDTIDYGRFLQACTALVRAVDAAGPNPSEEQQESILQSYQRLIAWREDLNAKLLQMDGALDVAAAKVRQALL